MTDFENQIEITLNEVGRAERSIGEEQERAERVRKNLRALYGDMQTGIRHGSYEANDEILAGVVAIYGNSLADRLELIGDFKEINRRLKDKSGEKVLIVSRREARMGCTGFGGEHQIVTETDMILGELSGEDLLFDYIEQTCSLPTSRFACYQPRKQTLGEEVGVELSNVVIAYRGFGSPNSVDLGTDLRQTVGDYAFLDARPHSSERFPALEILVGNEEIELWSTPNKIRGSRYFEVLGLQELTDNLYDGKLF